MRGMNSVENKETDCEKRLFSQSVFNITSNLVPRYFKIPVMLNAIFQIKIYKCLIWYACALGFFFEISDYAFIKKIMI